VANEASNRVALRNGFILEGCLRQAEFLNGSFYDQNIYGQIIDRSS
jgi:ribosomal-protein-serine acetyltransferase